MLNQNEGGTWETNSTQEGMGTPRMTEQENPRIKATDPHWVRPEALKDISSTVKLIDS